MAPPPEFSSLSSSEKDALIATLLARIETLMAENAELRKRVGELEAKLGLPPKTPDNSGTPPSLGQKASQEASRKPKGKPHAGAHRPLRPDPTRKRDVMASNCPHCGADVSSVVQTKLEAYDRIEIPAITPDVTRVELYGGICPCCCERFKATPPEGLEPGSPFGPNLKALVVYLHYHQAIPLARLAGMMNDLLGLDISEGALVNILNRSRKAFAKQASLIRAKLLSSTILESDETGMRVGKQTWWNWVFHHGDSAAFVIEQSRGKAVVEQFLGDHRPDIWVSDRLAAQMGWAKKDHQVCLAHLMRDAQYAIDAGDDIFAPGVKSLLQDACAIGRRRPQLADATLRSYTRKLDDKLDALLRLSPKGSQGDKLKRMVKKFRQYFFVFVTNRDVPPTNNGSEQAIRPCVIFRKVTNCFRSQWGAKLYADIRSVLETARRRGIAALQAIRLTLDEIPLPAPP